MTQALKHPPSNYIDGEFIPIPGDSIVSRDPASPETIIWSGDSPIGHLDQAINAAQRAFDSWSATTLDERIAVMRSWQEVTKKHAPEMAGLIDIRNIPSDFPNRGVMPCNAPSRSPVLSCCFL